MTTLVWFRQDLRLADNPALAAGVARGAVVPVYIFDPSGAFAPGAATRWWLHHSLVSLDRDLRARGSALVLRAGPADRVLADLIGETGATHVSWNRRYEPDAVAQDARIKAALSGRGVAVESFNAALLHEPWTVKSGAGDPYKVFTPFWRACLARGEPDTPRPAPVALNGPPVAGESLESWCLLPTAPDWAGGLRASWTPGEAGAQARLAAFVGDAINGYQADRDRPDRDATSMLSPHLHFGEVSPRAVWHRVRATAGTGPGVERFFAELGWREFASHLLFHFPRLADAPLRREFERFPWAEDPVALAAWRRGRTGYPIVDAGMRQLWRTGWMHNRVRMIAASFLVKHLLVPWQRGASWFWDTLVDADLANNAAGWQWVAGSGADAAPYFRIFNPVLQGEKFDPEGAYVRAHLPELARVPARYLHRPWEAPADVLAAAGVTLGGNYPRPIIDHAAARARALSAFASLKDAA